MVVDERQIQEIVQKVLLKLQDKPKIDSNWSKTFEAFGVRVFFLSKLLNVFL